MPDKTDATDRFISPEKPPEGADRELLIILVEECAEVQQRATKALRFGMTERQVGTELGNDERLALEVGDIMEVVERLIARGILSEARIAEGQAHKKKQLAKYMQHQEGAPKSPYAGQREKDTP